LRPISLNKAIQNYISLSRLEGDRFENG